MTVPLPQHQPSLVVGHAKHGRMVGGMCPFGSMVPLSSWPRRGDRHTYVLSSLYLAGLL